MGNSTLRIPSYRRHKPSGQAVVTIGGRDIYLGTWNSAASRAEYNRIIAEWTAQGGTLPQNTTGDFTITELLAAFDQYAKGYYRGPDGEPTTEAANYKPVMRRLKKLYGRTSAADFGPLALKAVRQAMIGERLSRRTINHATNRIRRIFKWGVENELIPATVLQALQAVAGLRYGRSDAVETEPVQPVRDEFVDAVLPYVAPQVAAMIELQRVTGMRSGEVTIMRGADINTAGKVWVYTPTTHKTAWKGHHRQVYLGPKAQQVVKPFLKAGAKKGSGQKKGQNDFPGPERQANSSDPFLSFKPKACRRCGGSLAGSDAEPLRHQVWEIPEIQPLVTEYQLHRLTCPGCSTSTCAELPAGVPQSQAGPRLVALTALLMGCFKQSKRRVALFLEQVLNQPCSTGWVVKLQNQATAALTPAYEELAAQLPAEPVLGIDESPTKEARRKSWLWAFVASTYTVFALRTTRAATVLHDLLTDAFDGVVNCDRAKMYWKIGRPQWCWAHLKRDFQALIDHPDCQVKRLGHDLMRPTRELFRHWARCRDGTITRRGMLRLMQPIREKIDGLLLRGQKKGQNDFPGPEPQANSSDPFLSMIAWNEVANGASIGKSLSPPSLSTAHEVWAHPMPSLR